MSAFRTPIRNVSEPAAIDWIEVVREKVKDLRFGVVQIVVHDSHVVQIERTEKTRLDRRSDGKGGDAALHD
jgi:hypothetical protein